MRTAAANEYIVLADPRSNRRRYSRILAQPDAESRGSSLSPTPNLAGHRSGRRRLSRARGTVLGLDDHPTGALAQEVCRGGPDSLLARRRVDGRPVDHVGAHALGFLDECRPGVA